MFIKRLVLSFVYCAVTASAAQAAIEVKTTAITDGVRAWYAESNQVPVVDIQISFEGAGYASDPAGKEGRAALAAAAGDQALRLLDEIMDDVESESLVVAPLVCLDRGEQRGQ